MIHTLNFGTKPVVQVTIIIIITVWIVRIQMDIQFHILFRNLDFRHNHHSLHMNLSLTNKIILRTLKFLSLGKDMEEVTVKLKDKSINISKSLRNHQSLETLKDLLIIFIQQEFNIQDVIRQHSKNGDLTDLHTGILWEFFIGK